MAILQRGSSFKSAGTIVDFPANDNSVSFKFSKK